MHWAINGGALFMGFFVGGLSGWNLFGAFTQGEIGTRGGSVSRKKSPELFWFCTVAVAFVFGVIGCPFFLIGLGIPDIPAFALGVASALGTIVAIARIQFQHYP